MAPTFTNIYELVAIPYMNGEIQTPDALISIKRNKSFMVTNTRETDLSMFAEISGAQQFYSKEEIPFSIALPAFITSELKTALTGFTFLTFLVIDKVVASVLMSLGMMMLSPMLIAHHLKYYYLF